MKNRIIKSLARRVGEYRSEIAILRTSPDNKQVVYIL